MKAIRTSQKKDGVITDTYSKTKKGLFGRTVTKQAKITTDLKNKKTNATGTKTVTSKGKTKVKQLTAKQIIRRGY